VAITEIEKADIICVGSIVKLIGSEGADKNASTMVVLAFFQNTIGSFGCKGSKKKPA